MKVSYIKGVANHYGPESCVSAGNYTCEALTGGDAGQVLSHEKTRHRTPTLWSEAEGITEPVDIARRVRVRRGHRPCACIQALRTGAGRSRVWYEIGTSARIGNSKEVPR